MDLSEQFGHCGFTVMLLYLLCTLSRASVTWLETSSSITMFYLHSLALTNSLSDSEQIVQASEAWRNVVLDILGGGKETLFNEVALNLWFNLWENGFVLTAKFQHADAILISRSGSLESPAQSCVWAKASTEMCRMAKNCVMHIVVCLF